MKTSHVWIVEMEQRGKWMPSYTLLTKREALKSCAEWQGVSPTHKFRVRKYVRSSDIASGGSA